MVLDRTKEHEGSEGIEGTGLLCSATSRMTSIGFRSSYFEHEVVGD